MIISNLSYLEIDDVQASSIVGGKHQGNTHHPWHFRHCQEYWTVDGEHTDIRPDHWDEHWYKCPSHARVS